MFKTTLSLACVAAASLASPAMASPEGRERVETRIVHYADLDLSSAAGAKEMVRRISSAARAACGSVPMTGGWLDYQSYRECRTEAESKAVDRLGSPIVTALYQGRSVEPALAEATIR